MATRAISSASYRGRSLLQQQPGHGGGLFDWLPHGGGMAMGGAGRRRGAEAAAFSSNNVRRPPSLLPEASPSAVGRRRGAPSRRFDKHNIITMSTSTSASLTLASTSLFGGSSGGEDGRGSKPSSSSSSPLFQLNLKFRAAAARTFSQRRSTPSPMAASAPMSACVSLQGAPPSSAWRSSSCAGGSRCFVAGSRPLQQHQRWVGDGGDGGHGNSGDGGGGSAGRNAGYRFREYQGWDGGPSPGRGKLLWRPLVFTGAVVLGSFAAAAIIYSERQTREHWTVRMGILPAKGHNVRNQVHDFWGWHLTTGQVVATGLIAANVAVHLLFSASKGRGRAAARLSQFLERNFLHFPFSGRAFPLLGSTFAHADWFHLGFNMAALWSFAPLIVSILGPETFLAAYASSGVITSLGGMLVQVAMRVTIPSCGASGALLFLFSTSALLFPASRYSIIFFPFLSFNGPELLFGVVGLDLIGLLMGWRMFNHGAHLTGVLLGVMFVNGGGKLLHVYQVWCIQKWRELRKSLRNK